MSEPSMKEKSAGGVRNRKRDKLAKPVRQNN